MSEHTPGPWKFNGWQRVFSFESGEEEEVIIKDDICHVYGESPEANARLIAAAPELLDACERALETIEYLWSGKYASRLYDNETKKRIQAVIAKATGGET